MYRFTNPRAWALCFAVVIACADRLPAQANMILNGSFESPNTGTSVWVTATGVPNYIANWTVTDGTSLQINDADSWVLSPAADGHQFWLPVYGSGGVKGTILQTFATESGKTYDVSFYYAFLDATHYGLGSIMASLTYDVGGTPTTLSIPADTPWTKESFQFTASGPTTTLSFSGGASSGTAYPGPNLDNVIVTAHSIPEPRTTVLLLPGAGGVFYCFCARGKRRQGRKVG